MSSRSSILRAPAAVPTPTRRAEARPASLSWGLARSFMQQRCGVVLDSDQEYLLESRLHDVATAAGFPGVTEFVAAATRHGGSPALVERLVDALTTHETSFFRDRAFWSVLEQKVLPELLAGHLRDGGELKVWSAACSTGQEAYSLLMLLEESFPQLAGRVRVVATDIAELTVRRAAAGLFSELELQRGVSPARRERFFEREGDAFRVRSALRSRIEFRAHNLLAPLPPVTGCHIAMCRNVLIYFEEPQRLAALRCLASSLLPGTFIGVGSTELIRGEQVAPGWYRAPHPRAAK
ncbi:MAG: protein-glutamate O-methyltransferase CheR [Polyangiales bacterium]